MVESADVGTCIRRTWQVIAIARLNAGCKPFRLRPRSEH
jgi:hypothetical protein